MSSQAGFTNLEVIQFTPMACTVLTSQSNISNLWDKVE
uniref:Uncharacterized protein n=1 Tax=Anguilla anguilla TaxID=7936 RepID=A0A0E9PPY4_ANGAN